MLNNTTVCLKGQFTQKWNNLLTLMSIQTYIGREQIQQLKLPQQICFNTTGLGQGLV